MGPPHVPDQPESARNHVNDRDRKLLLVAAVWLGFVAILLEIVNFRLATSFLGSPHGALVAFAGPTLLALGGLFFGRTRTPERAIRRAAHLAAAAGGLTAISTVGLTFASQTVARANGEGTWVAFGVAMASVLLPCIPLGGVFANLYHALASRAGRLGFAVALGAAFGLTVAPKLFGLVGAPRLLLLLGGALGLFALLLAWVVNFESPRWAWIITVPLAVTSLTAGDVYVPWIKMRLDDGRRTRVIHSSWSPSGGAGVFRFDRGKGEVTIDRQPKLTTSNDHKGKPRFVLVDLPYLMPLDDAKGTPVAKRSVMVINGVGGREVQVAKAYGFGHIDVFEDDVSVVRDLFVERYGHKTGHILQQPDVVQLHDGLYRQTESQRRYSRIIVHGIPRYSDVPTRLTNHQRLLSRPNIRGYLNHLDPDGAMYLLLPQSGVASAFAAIMEAWSLNKVTAAPHVMVCARADATHAVILVHGKPRDLLTQRKLAKRCRSSRYYEAYPLDMKSPQVESKSSAFAVLDGRIADVARPFATPVPAVSQLRTRSRDFLATLRPIKETKKPKRSKRGKTDAEPAESPHPTFEPVVGRAMAAFLMGLWAMVVLLLVVLAPARDSADGARLPVSWRLSVAIFGIGHAATLLALVDIAGVSFGSRSSAYLVLLPASFAGLAIGRLAVDTAKNSELQRRVAVFLVAGVAALLAIYAAGRITSFGAQTGAALGAAFVGSLVVGAPLAVMVRRTLDIGAPVFGARLWSGYVSGWAFGAAAASLLMNYWGHHRVFALGAAAFAVGVVLHVATGRGRSPAATS